MTKTSTLEKKRLNESVVTNYEKLKPILDKVEFKPSFSAIQNILDYAKKQL